MSHPGPALIQAARDDAPGAVEQLVDHSLPVVLAWCNRLASPGIHPEDAAHDVFEILLDRLHTLRNPEAYMSWLYGITRRVLARHRRRAWLRRWLPGAEYDIRDHAIDPLQGSERNEIVRRVRQALLTMPVHHREVLVLCDLEERTNTEVAEILGIPAPTVRSRLRRARARLRLEVTDLGEELSLQVAEGGKP